LNLQGKLLKNDIQNVINLMVDSQNTLSIPGQSTAPPSSIVDSNNTHRYTYSPNQSYHYHSMSSSNVSYPLAQATYQPASSRQTTFGRSSLINFPRETTDYLSTFPLQNQYDDQTYPDR